MKRVMVVLFDDDNMRESRVIGPIPYLDVIVNIDANSHEVRTNPQMMAILSGADMAVWKDLEGETVSWINFGNSVEVRIR